MSSLARFVAEQKEKYLQAIADGTAKEWTVVMGNEAGGTMGLVRTSQSALLTNEAGRPQTWTR